VARGIERFAPLLLASLLLHLAGIVAVWKIDWQKRRGQHIPPYLLVEPAKWENRGGEERIAAPVAQRPAAPDSVTPQNRAVTAIPNSEPIAPELFQKGFQESAPLLRVSDSPPAARPGITEPHTASHGGTGGTVVLPTGARTGVSRIPGPAPESATEHAATRRSAYQALLKRLIEARKEYPLAARKAGLEGSCLRRFVLSRSGALKQVETASSCGHMFLDEAATRAITAIGSFPPVPDEFKGAEATFTVDIIFRLKKAGGE